MKLSPICWAAAFASLYLSVVPFVIYVCIPGRLKARIALRSQRARSSLSWPLSTTLRVYAFAHGVTARS